jgi:hypothetical protein
MDSLCQIILPGISFKPPLRDAARDAKTIESSSASCGDPQKVATLGPFVARRRRKKSKISYGQTLLPICAHQRMACQARVWMQVTSPQSSRPSPPCPKERDSSQGPDQELTSLNQEEHNRQCNSW